MFNTIFNLVIIFIGVWLGFKIVDYFRAVDETRLVARQKAINESIFMTAEEVKYKDEKILLGVSVLENTFLGQANDLLSLYKQVFARFPQKNIIFYYIKDAENGKLNPPVSVTRDQILNQT